MGQQEFLRVRGSSCGQQEFLRLRGSSSGQQEFFRVSEIQGSEHWGLYESEGVVGLSSENSVHTVEYLQYNTATCSRIHI